MRWWRSSALRISCSRDTSWKQLNGADHRATGVPQRRDVDAGDPAASAARSGSRAWKASPSRASRAADIDHLLEGRAARVAPHEQLAAAGIDQRRAHGEVARIVEAGLPRLAARVRMGLRISCVSSSERTRARRRVAQPAAR